MTEQEKAEMYDQLTQVVYSVVQEELQDIWACMERILVIFNHKDTNLPDEVQEDVETIEQKMNKWY